MKDNKRIILNIGTGIFFKLVLLILAIVNTRFVILNLGKDINGLLALFASIIGFLSIVELGIGNAITFSMYKPIVDEDYDKVSALYYLYRKMYRSVMVLLVIIGSIVAIFVPILAKDYSSVYSIRLTYLLFLSSIVITYLFAHKTSTINAFKDNYLATMIHSIVKIIEVIIQITVLIITKNFIIFLVTKIMMALLEYLITSVIFSKRYKKHINDNKLIDANEKSDIVKNIKALFMINLGAILILSTDNILISAFIGVGELGKYNLYTTIIGAMAGTISLVFIEITSILGHKNITFDYKQRLTLFKKTHSINYILGIVFFLGFYSVANSLVNIIYGEGNNYSNLIIGVITLNYFVEFMRKSVATFKNSLGLFHQERFRPIIEGFSNLILSLILIQYMGIVGVLLATIITRLAVLYTIEPYVVFKYGFDEKPFNFYFMQYLSSAVLILALIVIKFIRIDLDSNILNLIVNGSISIGISLIIILITYIIIKPFRESINLMFKDLNKRIFKKGWWNPLWKN